jgi:hypothetical protein
MPALKYRIAFFCSIGPSVSAIVLQRAKADVVVERVEPVSSVSSWSRSGALSSVSAVGRAGGGVAVPSV